MGCDFLSCNQLGITWGPEGILQLRDKQDLSIQTAEEITNSAVMLAAKTVIPSRSLVLVTVSTTLPSCRDKTRFDFIPTQTNPYLGPNCVVYPLDYASIKGGLQRGFTDFDKFRPIRCNTTTGNSVRAFPKGQI